MCVRERVCVGVRVCERGEGTEDFIYLVLHRVMAGILISCWCLTKKKNPHQMVTVGVWFCSSQ